MTVIYFNVSRRRRTSNLSTTFVSDEDLFKQPPQAEDCPICFLRLPTLGTGERYKSCCGKVVCSGCIHAVEMTSGKNLCPFCRALVPEAAEEVIKRLKKRIQLGDSEAMYELGCCYSQGIHGLPQDMDKALELWYRAGKLGNPVSYYNIGNAYLYGRGVEEDWKKAIHNWELAAIWGVVEARHNLGSFEANKGNYNRALKHYMIAVEGGNNDSLMMIKQLYANGRATRDDYARAFKAYQTYLDEIRSDDRDKAASFSHQYRYY